MSEPTATIKQTTMPPFVISLSHANAIDPLTELKPGDHVEDFQIVKELGRGGFAAVYLAKQLSLDRLVALKFSANRGLGEGQTLAVLEHDHIVKVYSEFVEPKFGRHCLCLQYVPGTNLYSLIKHLHRDESAPRNGQELLLAIDQLCLDSVAHDPSAQLNREILSRSTFAEAACVIGVQMAQALSFAHARRILHCDIKPANILVNRYGRPMLVDFNVAVDSSNRAGLGGTLNYMSPEHLHAIGSQTDPALANIDARSDIYSLGIVLFELLVGDLPFAPIAKPTEKTRLCEVAKSRIALPDASIGKLRAVSPALGLVIERCLEHDPSSRYLSGMELAESLANAREILRIQRKLPAPGRVTRFAQNHLFYGLLLAAVLPSVLGSILNIAYNAVEIRLNEEQQRFFPKLVLAYNAVIYPAGIVVLVLLIRKFFRSWNRFLGPRGLSNEETDRLRSFVLQFPYWGIGAAAVGWFPGAVVFPVAIDSFVGPLPGKGYTHFAISFILSGMVSIIYSFYFIQWLTLRVIYPQLDTPDRERGTPVMRELRASRRWLGPFQVMAGAVPLIGVVLLLSLSEETITIWFRLLAISLIAMAMIGMAFAVQMTHNMVQLLHTLGESPTESFTDDTSRFIDIRHLPKMRDG